MKAIFAFSFIYVVESFGSMSALFPPPIHDAKIWKNMVLYKRGRLIELTDEDIVKYLKLYGNRAQTGFSRDYAAE